MEIDKNIGKEKVFVDDQDIQKVLLDDLGVEARLISWKTQDFTQSGDNYASYVTSIVVNYSFSNGAESEENISASLRNTDQREAKKNNSVEKLFPEDECKNKERLKKSQENVNTVNEITYIIKCNPDRENKSLESYTKFQFEKECRFYSDLAQPLSAMLQSINEPDLGLPRCFLTKMTEGKQVIIFEDLRRKGFYMPDRKRGLDKVQTLLVIKELALFHAASVLLQRTNLWNWKEIMQKCEYLSKDRTNYDTSAGEKFRVMFSLIIENAEEVLKKVGKHLKAIDWLATVRENIVELYQEQFADSPKFNVICHGDCWINNILFRYTDGVADEVNFLDLQMCRVASLATDLSYFLYSSVETPVRTKHLQEFLQSYHDIFYKTLQAAGIEAPFTLEDLQEEFQAKKLLGIITACTIIPAILIAEEKLLDYSNMKDGGIVGLMTRWRERMLQMVDDNAFIHTRFISIFKELEEAA